MEKNSQENQVNPEELNQNEATQPETTQLEETQTESATDEVTQEEFVEPLIIKPDPNQPTICLTMIVKNEAQVIRRCIDSVRRFISYWVIVDTGSTDGTQENKGDNGRV